MTVRVHSAVWAVSLLLASAAGAQPFGNTLRITGTGNTSFRICSTSCLASEVPAVAFGFVPAAAMDVKAIHLRTANNSSGTLRVSLQTGPLGSGTVLSTVVGISAPQNNWIVANFFSAGQPTGAVPLAADTQYYVVMTHDSGNNNEPNIVVAVPGSTAPVGTTRKLDARTGADLSLSVYTSDGGAFGAEYTDLAPVMVVTTTAADPWAPSCGTVDLPFGNPYQYGFDVTGGSASPIAQKFVYGGAPDGGATGVSVLVNSVVGTLNANLSDGTKSVSKAFTSGAAWDGDTLWTATFSDALPLVPGRTYTLTVTSTSTFSLHGMAVNPPSPANACLPQARATWHGKDELLRTGTTDNPFADLWFEVSTCPQVRTYYEDVDGDGYGKTTVTRDLCDSTSGWSIFDGDCNDVAGSGALVHPEADELCDGIDNNCTGTTDEGCDDDGDDYCDIAMIKVGSPAVCPLGGNDCDDDQASVHPNAAEICDGFDNDCDGPVDNADPTFQLAACGLSAGVCAGALHLASECDGGAWDPCPDSRYGVYYEPVESLCDTRDNDCDGLADEGCVVDAGFDAGIDAGTDGGFDAGTDAGTDAGADAGFDAGTDAGIDAGVDAGSDAGSPDGGSADAGSADGGDAGAFDGGAGDAGLDDAGIADAGTDDAGTGDGGAEDAGTEEDGGTFDAGSSATDGGGPDAGTGGTSLYGCGCRSSEGGGPAAMAMGLLAWCGAAARRRLRRRRG